MKKNYYFLLLLPLLLVSCKKEKNTIYNQIISANKVEAYYKTNEDESISYYKVDPFNTSMYLRYYFDSKNEGNDLLKESISSVYNDTISSLHSQFDRHNRYIKDGEFVVNIKTINDSFGTGNKIKCSNELYNLLKDASLAYTLTNGYYNMFTGRVTDFWDEVFSEIYNYGSLNNYDPYYENEYKTKLQSIVNELPLTDIQFQSQLTFFDDTKEVIFNKLENQSDNYHPLISVGGIAKGIATDICKTKLLENNYRNGILFSGGSSISLLSDPSFLINPSNGQSLSIINPLKPHILDSKSAMVITFFNEFNNSTSGNYTDNKHYGFIDSNTNDYVIRYHIFNPNTGCSENYHEQVTCISNKISNGMLDCLTTALMCCSVTEGKTIINNFKTYFNCSDLHVYWLDENSDGNAKIIALDNLLKLTLGEDVTIAYEN